ncbi:MAG: hypothetical protein ABIK86_06745 [candidate division WOR-3 bacterium]
MGYAVLLLATCLVAYPDSAVVISRLGHEGGLAPSFMRAISRDGRGWVHVAFAYNIGFPLAESAEVFYTFSTDDGQNWAPLENVSRNDSFTVCVPALTVDAASVVHCVWNQFWIDSSGTRHYDFFYASRDSTGWSVAANVSRLGWNTNAFYEAGIVVDRLGRPHVVFHYGYNRSRYDGAIYHCYKDGDTWTRPFCLTPVPIWENQYPSLTIDRRGRLHVAWMLYEFASNRDTIYYALYDSVWHPAEVVYAAGIVAGVPCIAVDSSNTPWVAFIAGPFGGANDVYCAHRDSTGWHCMNISNSPEQCYEVGITLDRNDHVYVVWPEFVPERDLFMRTYDGHAWSAIQNLTADSGFASFAGQLAFPTGDRIDLAWRSRDPTLRSDEVVYMRLSRVVAGFAEPSHLWTAPMPRATLNPTREPAAFSTAGTVYAASGRQVRSIGHNTGSTVHLPAGVYFYRPEDRGQTRKLVVVR